MCVQIQCVDTFVICNVIHLPWCEFIYLINLKLKLKKRGKIPKKTRCLDSLAPLPHAPKDTLIYNFIHTLDTIEALHVFQDKL